MLWRLLVAIIAGIIVVYLSFAVVAFVLSLIPIIIGAGIFMVVFAIVLVALDVNKKKKPQ